MTRDLFLCCWSATAALLVACQLLSFATHRRFAGASDLIHRLARTRGGAALLLLGWTWLGWHFFAR
jgi:hypothetical protein